MTYVLWMGAFFVYFKLFEKKSWKRVWRWLLSLALGYLTAVIIMALVVAAS